MTGRPRFYEFFAGGGMVRLGLGEGWDCLFANDFNAKKATAYRDNWNGGSELLEGDVWSLTAADLPGRADLAWASFPCQDLSLAGGRKGVGDVDVDTERATRSGAFWPFRRLMRRLREEDRAPTLIALENVVGALTSNGGRDFAAIVAALGEMGYRCGALAIDAALFVPQSRPRLFIVALRNDVAPPAELVAAEASPLWTPKSLTAAHAGLTDADRENWLWWRLPAPPAHGKTLADMLEDAPAGAPWRPQSRTDALIDMMSPRHRAKLAAIQADGRPVVCGVYKRIRVEDGRRVQRAEARFDGVAGCLRTPSGGSSRQTVLAIDGASVRSRLLSAREAARLMGLPDGYRLPARYNDAYHLAGDGVAPPVVAWLARRLFEPILAAAAGERVSRTPAL